MSRSETNKGTLMVSPGAACSTSRMKEKSKSKGQVPPTAPCPCCGVAVAQEQVGGAIRRFCSASCRWAWHRQERGRKLIEAIEATTCEKCREAVLKVVRKGNGGAAP